MRFLRRPPAVALITALLLASAACASGLPFAFVHHGDFQRMMATGDLSGKVALASLPRDAGSWGVGATAGLQGEILQVDGRLLVTPGSDPRGGVRPPRDGEQAVLFAGGRVSAWHDVVVDRDMDAASFEAFVRAQAGALGLALDQPFVFRVEGRFPHLRWHVVTGEQAPRGAHAGGKVSGDSGPGHGSGHGSGHGGGGPGGGPHANARSAQRVFQQPGAIGQLVGVYSGEALEGAVSHPGERFHVHFADGGATLSGHVDRYSIAAGATLKLPVR